MGSVKVSETKISCSCGEVHYEITSTPLLRFICHCTICQKFNNASFGDAIIYSSSGVKDPDSSLVESSTYKPPPNVKRGKCISCVNPVIEKLQSPLLPKLTIVPTATHHKDIKLPQPVAHLFYDQCIEQVDDSLPKYKGYLSSQLAFVRHLMSAKFKR